MAEIHIERQERGIWPWVLIGLLALGLIAGLLMRNTGGNDVALAIDSATGSVVDSPSTPDPAGGTAAPAAVSEYFAFVEEHRTRAVADSTHGYTADGIRRLAAALDALIQRDTVGGQSLDSQVTWLEERADALQRDWRSPNHARATRDAFLGAASLIQSMHERRFANIASETTAVVNAAERVSPATPLLQQTADVQQFFDRAADALRAMLPTT